MADFAIAKSNKIQSASLPNRADFKPEESASRQEAPIKDDERLKLITSLLKSSKDGNPKFSGSIDVDKYTVSVVDLGETPAKELKGSKDALRYSVSVILNDPKEETFVALVSPKGKVLKKELSGDTSAEQYDQLPDLSKERAALVDQLLRKAATNGTSASK